MQRILSSAAFFYAELSGERRCTHVIYVADICGQSIWMIADKHELYLLVSQKLPTRYNRLSENKVRNLSKLKWYQVSFGQGSSAIRDGT
jgi:hypothetical protein